MNIFDIRKIENRIILAIIISFLSVLMSLIIDKIDYSISHIWGLINFIPFCFALISGNGHEPNIMIFRFMIALQWFLIALLLLYMINAKNQKNKH
jgi:uncharacterized membrane protein YhaH (DUF805 family)